MTTIIDLLYDYFYEHFFGGSMSGITDGMTFNVGGSPVDGTDWLCLTASYITAVFIFVLCCLFVYKIIKLIGGLIR